MEHLANILFFSKYVCTHNFNLNFNLYASISISRFSLPRRFPLELPLLFVCTIIRHFANARQRESGSFPRSEINRRRVAATRIGWVSVRGESGQSLLSVIQLLNCITTWYFIMNYTTNNTIIIGRVRDLVLWNWNTRRIIRELLRLSLRLRNKSD